MYLNIPNDVILKFQIINKLIFSPIDLFSLKLVPVPVVLIRELAKLSSIRQIAQISP